MVRQDLGKETGKPSNTDPQVGIRTPGSHVCVYGVTTVLVHQHHNSELF